MDFTGELNRYAVLRATARDLPAVHQCRDVVDQLFGQLMLFEWRNGNLRRKFDAVKYTLKKLEQVCLARDSYVCTEPWFGVGSRLCVRCEGNSSTCVKVVLILLYFNYRSYTS